ncbi:MAG: carboxypeptidase regulatory-like domain-containing protein [Candidatus Diapherotrites archaeon]|nr:carboxypeptidase regulatory-like domain-containing protein [Candidatus Diapherotrites archaeon]
MKRLFYMGLLGKLKELYYSAEDRYYSLLDALQAKGAPVYGVVDAVDRVVPSFALLLAMVLLVLVFGAAIFLQQAMPNQGVHADFAVVDLTGQGLSSVKINFIVGSAAGEAVSGADGRFSVAAGNADSIEIAVREQLVNGKTVSGFAGTFAVQAGVEQKIVLQYAGVEVPTKTIIFKAPSGERVARKGTSVRLSCRQGTLPIEVLADDDGDGKIIVENVSECIGLSATVLASGFGEETFQLPQPVNTLTLTPELLSGGVSGAGAVCGDGVCQNSEDANACANDCEGKIRETGADLAIAGKIRVTIADEKQGIVTSTNFSVRLNDFEGGLVAEKNTEYYGQAVFKGLLPGRYSVVVSDANGAYSGYSQQGIEVLPAQETAVNAVVSRNVRARLVVSAIEKGSGGRIGNAVVSVRNANGAEIGTGKTGTGGEDAIVSFFDPQANLAIVVSQDDYFYGTAGIASLSGEQNVSIELEKVTEENSGKVRVQVFDEDDVAVEGAIAKLLFENGNLAPYPARSTDANGVALWAGVKEETLYPSAYKAQAYAAPKGIAKKILKKELNEFRVRLVIGDADVEIEATDEQGAPLQNSQAEFFNMLGESIAKFDLPNGKASQKIRAGQKAFVVITSPGHVSFTTIPKTLFANTKAEFSGELPLQGGIAGPKIEFIGMLDNYRQSNAMEAGHSYIALFRLSVPAGVEGAGVHFRAGDQAGIAGENLFVGAVDIGNAAIEKGAAYNPPAGTDAENPVPQTGMPGKWANARFAPDGKEMVAEAGFEVVVKSSTPAFSPLPMHYRAWTASGDSYSRMPADTELGAARETASKKELYAKTFDLSDFQEGVLVRCDSDFCYAGEKVLDLRENLFLDPPYDIIVFAPYEVSFIIRNNSDAEFAQPALSISSVDSRNAEDNGIAIEGYSVLDTQSNIVENANFNASKISAIPLPNFSKGKSVLVKLRIRGSKVQANSLETKIFSAGQTLFREKIGFRTRKNESLVLSAEPDKLHAFEEKDILVTVKDRQGKLLENVLLKARKRLADGTETMLSCISGNNCLSDGQGKAVFHLPASSPSTQIVFEAEKIGYWQDAQLKLVVSDEIIAFEPESLASGVNSRNRTEEIIQETLTMKNFSGAELGLAEAGLSGKNSRFFALLDYTSMLSFLRAKTGVDSGNGLKLAGLEEKEVSGIIKTKIISPLLIAKNESVDGQALFTFENAAFAKTYDVQLPLKVAISLGDVPATPCVSIDNPDWVDFTDNGKTDGHISSITNNCEIDGTPIALDGLKFSYQPNSGGHLGDVSLSLKDGTGREIGLYALPPNVPIGVLEKIPAGQSVSASLVFTSKLGAENNDAGFDIQVNGLLKSEHGFDETQATRDFSGRISLVNLSTCISYSPENGRRELADNPGTPFFDPTGEITVSIENCPNISQPVRIRLCYQDGRCSGGTEGGLSLSEKDFELVPGPNTNHKTIKVDGDRDIAGVYGINVYGNFASRAPKKLRKDDILVFNPAHWENGRPWAGMGYFSMDRYDLKVFPGSEDKTALYNNAYIEQVKVRADGCVWKDLQNTDRAKFRSYVKTAALIATSIQVSVTVTALLSIGLGVSIGGVTAALAGGTTAATIGTSFAINIAIGVIAYFAVMLLADLFFSCHDVHAVNTLPAFVINLGGSTSLKDPSLKVPPDTSDDMLSVSGFDGKIKPEWNFREGRDGLFETQEIDFSNQGYGSDLPEYGILTVSANEHVHGDFRHDNENGSHGTGDDSYDIECSSGTLAEYNIGDSPEQGSCNGISTRTYSQKFHIRVQTKELQQWQPVQLSNNVFACNANGRTGEGALPKVNLNWKWTTDGSDNINAESCDADNPDGIYCDATQFSIALTQKMQFLREFFDANPVFFCPVNPEYKVRQGVAEENTRTASQKDVPAGKIGLQRLRYDKDENDNFKFTVEVFNRTSEDRTVKVHFRLRGTEGNAVSGDEEKEISVARNSSAELGFDGNALGKSGHPFIAYALFAPGFVNALPASDATHYSTDNLQLLFWNFSPPADEECWLKNTTYEVMPGVSGVEAFFDRDLETFGELINADQQEPNWTEHVPDKETLRKLLRPRVNLIRDGYSDDFQKDFAEFYAHKTFYNTPSYFDSDGTGKFADYFADTDRLDFQYTTSSDKLPDAGTYDAQAWIDFGDGWKFFGPDGKPKAKILVKFYYKGYPEPQSTFYYLPFDGKVGVGTSNGRQGYGLNYLNSGQAVKISTENSQDIIETKPIENSDAMTLLRTKIEADPAKINGLADTRGALLSVRRATGTDKEMTFSPNYATPVVMKMSSDKTDGSRLSAYYQLFQAGQPKTLGTVFAYWAGMSNCKDFSGDFASNVFWDRPDRKGNSSDPVPGAENAYAVDWQSAEKKGNVFLKTVVFTPANSNYVLKALSPGDGTLSFTTMNSETGTTVNLNGLGGMKKNNLASNGTVQELNDLFRMVGDQTVCLSDSGDKSVFYWNALKLFEENGAGGKSVEGFESGLSAGNTCIS